MENEEKLKCSTAWSIVRKDVWKKVKDVSFEDIVNYMYQPTDPSSLGIIRFLFGLLMLIDLSEERGGSDIDIRWGDPKDCHFPLFPILTNPGFPCICLAYFAMCLGACGIMLGYKFRISVFLFGIPYWYILLLDKSFWNNHSYLFGVVTILLMGSSANHFLSFDGYLDDSKRNKHVPYWNYFILKYQFFMLYFLAGLKKTDTEWLEGYSMTNLGNHWVFAPFRILLSSGQIDFIVVHWFGFLLDLTIGFWLLIEFTRPVAMLFCSCFHLMNSRLFSIGMFPYVCLATMPLFCKESWPRKIQSLFTRENLEASPSPSCIYPKGQMKNGDNTELHREVNWKHKLVVTLLICHCGLQAFLPYSHFITKGYNNWTNGLYGYSWDMMVHSWDTILVVVKIVDNDTGKEHFLDADAWTHNDRWSKHADMCVQYAECLKKNHDSESREEAQLQPQRAFTPKNISVYVDVWCSLNKRFQQRMFDPQYDLLKANWSPFQPVQWLMPVLWQYSDFRKTMKEISDHVYSWSDYSDVLFIADFPGLYLENFINEDLDNVTLTVLEGKVAYEVEDESSLQSIGVKLEKGQSTPVEVGLFHRIHTISETPSCYMYTFTTKGEHEKDPVEKKRFRMYSPFPLFEDIQQRLNSFFEYVESFWELYFVYFVWETVSCTI
ncbi:hypothetical protein JTB14_021558 [Gonioctena quinquepunctata]|nr:hypothetical protein JTB14_021558 [Gonioctena quinquepunctata]